MKKVSVMLLMVLLLTGCGGLDFSEDEMDSDVLIEQETAPDDSLDVEESE